MKVHLQSYKFYFKISCNIVCIVCNLVFLVREGCGKQRNGERIKRRKLKLKRVLKLLRWNPLVVFFLLPIAFIWVTSGQKQFLVSLTGGYRNSCVSFVAGSETCMLSTGEDELVNSLLCSSGTRTGFKYEWADLLQLTEVPTRSITAADMLPPAPGPHFSEQQFRKCIFITF